MKKISLIIIMCLVSSATFAQAAEPVINGNTQIINGTATWVPISSTNPSSSSSVAEGNIVDSAATNSTSSWSVIALLKGEYALLASGVLGQAANAIVTAVSNGTPVNVQSRTDGAQVVQLGCLPDTPYNIGAVTLADNTEHNLAVGTSGQRLGLHTLSFWNKDTVAHTVTIRVSASGTIAAYISAAAGSVGQWQDPVGIWGGINANDTVTLDANPTTTSPLITGQACWIGAK